jgi:hypothetical protein
MLAECVSEYILIGSCLKLHCNISVILLNSWFSFHISCIIECENLVSARLLILIKRMLGSVSGFV